MSPTITPIALHSLRMAADRAKPINYTPYSRFVVLAAVQTIDDRHFGGSNVENANYSLTKHAEEVAILHALTAELYLEPGWLKTLYVAGGAPCGSCRQFAYEFANESTVVVVEKVSQASLRDTAIVDLVGSIPAPDVWRLSDLLPAAFGPRDLHPPAANSQE